VLYSTVLSRPDVLDTSCLVRTCSIHPVLSGRALYVISSRQVVLYSSVWFRPVVLYASCPVSSGRALSVLSRPVQSCSIRPVSSSPVVLFTSCIVPSSHALCALSNPVLSSVIPVQSCSMRPACHVQSCSKRNLPFNRLYPSVQSFSIRNVPLSHALCLLSRPLQKCPLPSVSSRVVVLYASCPVPSSHALCLLSRPV
jgi:hypothetical protein